MTEQLKPCPFCGRQPKRVSTSFSERFAYAQEVSYVCSCGCRRSARGDTSKGGYADNSKVEENALAAWNTRALTTSQPAQAGEVNERCAGCGMTASYETVHACKTPSRCGTTLKTTQPAAQATPDVPETDFGNMATQQAAGEPVGEPAGYTFVQPVPEQCDRIIWRGQYIHLPITHPAPGVPEGFALVPIKSDDAILRPFYNCPPEELGLAWDAAMRVAQVRLAAAQANGGVQ